MREVSMGFTDQRFPAGIHICYIYKDKEKRKQLMARYIEAGLINGEKVAYFTDTISPCEAKVFMKKFGIVIPDNKHSEALHIQKAQDAYCPEGRFVPDNMLNMLRAFYTRSRKKGYSGARASGEMSWALNDIHGSDRVMEYEALLNDAFRMYPVTAICQYDANRFDDVALFRVLQTHPFMIMDGYIVKNPYYDQSANLPGRMYLLQDKLFSLPDDKKTAECLHEGLEVLPGVSFIHACIQGTPSRKSLIYNAICSSCRNTWNELDDTLRYTCAINKLPDIRCFPLTTHTGNYGFLNIAVNKPEQFRPYAPHIQTIVNVVSTVVENKKQRHPIEIADDKLQRDH
jgi:hypothetical protein